MKNKLHQPIYLDWNATAPLHSVAREAIVETLTEVGNPSSVHHYGRAARQKLEQARGAILKLVGLPPELSEQFPAVIFTASGTEANNLAVNGWPRLAISDIEHSSMLLAREDAVTLGVQDNGLVDLAAVETICELWRGSQFMVSVMLANNETGVIQPISKIAQIVHAAGGYLHSDACQAAGRIPLDMAELGVDLLTLSGHKLGGGYGSAALVRRTEIPLKPLLNGGGQEFGLRSGTENLTAIAGFAAIAQIEPTLLAAAPKIARLRDQIAALAQSILPEAVIIASEQPRLPNTLCIALPGIVHTTQLMAFDLSGIAISAGSACASGTIQPSRVLQAMGLPPEVLASAVRLSLGPTTDETILPRIAEVWTQLRKAQKQ